MSIEKSDMTVLCGEGMINIRVGAIIMKNGKILMTGNARNDYLFSVGGRVKFGETADEAIVREVYEETGVKMEIDRLGFVHEDYFYGESPLKRGMTVYEICFYYYMKVPEDFEPKCVRFTDNGFEENLCWISPNDPMRYYPAFFRTELSHPEMTVRHIVTDER